MTDRHELVPEIRFDGFNGEWVARTLKEFGKPTGGTSIESEFIEGGKYRVISIGSYSESSVYVEQWLRVNATEKTSSRILNKNDLTMILNDKTSSGRIIGRVLLIDEDDTYVYNQRTERIEVYKDIYDPQFLYQLLNADTIREKIIRSAQGNTQIYVNWSAISELLYFAPNIREEQTAIGSFFRNLDETIKLKNQQHEKLVNIKKSMLEKMFPPKGANVPEIRFAGFVEPWVERKLGEVADIVGGGTPDTFNSEYWDGDIDWYSPYEIGSEVFAAGSKRKLTRIGLEKSSAKILPADRTILFTSRAGIGDMAILKNPAATNQGFQSLVINDGYCVYFIYSMGNRIKEYALRNASGSTFLEISGKVLSRMELLVPSFTEQTAVGNFFCALDTLITESKQELEKLQNIKKACLEKMFI